MNFEFSKNLQDDILSCFFIINEEQEKRGISSWKFRNLRELDQHIKRQGGQLDLSRARIMELPEHSELKQALPSLKTVITSRGRVNL